MNNELNQAYSVEGFRQMGYQLVNLLADYLHSREQENDFPTIQWQDPEEELAYWRADLQKEDKGTPIDFFKQLFERSIHLHNRRYMGHQISPPAPLGALGGLMNDFINNGMGIYEMGMAGTAIEKVVIEVVAKHLGFEEHADGVLTSGGTLANLTALLAARQAKAPNNVWKEGHKQSLALLVSEQAHYCVDRAVRIMGWGEAGIIKVPVDEKYQISTNKLEEIYNKVKNENKKVIAIIGSACSTSTGSFDDLEALADFSERHQLWFHVDGAHGAASIFSEQYKHLVKGIERADSVVMDFHKMLMTPALATALVFRDGKKSYATFSQKAQYLWNQQEALEWHNLAKRTFECTKMMMSVKVYSLIRTYGISLFDQFVTSCYDLGKRFAAKIKAQAELELALEPACNIVCFRYNTPQLSKDHISQFNQQIRQQILEDGQFYIVQTSLKEETWLRTTFTNPFTSENDLQKLILKIISIAKKIK